MASEITSRVPEVDSEIRRGATSGKVDIGKRIDVNLPNSKPQKDIVDIGKRIQPENRGEQASKEQNGLDPRQVNIENYDDKVKLQEKEIKAIESGEKEFDKDDSHEVGNYGEMKMDQALRKEGYDRISSNMVTEIGQITRPPQGLDGVYCNEKGHPKYIIAEAKYGSSKLGDTLDGKQMCEKYIDARLDKAVGPEKADEIRMEKILHPENVESYLVHTSRDGNVTFDKLDKDANVVEKDVRIDV